MGIGVVSQIKSDRTRENSVRSCQGRFSLDIGENFFMERASPWFCDWERTTPTHPHHQCHSDSLLLESQRCTSAS